MNKYVLLLLCTFAFLTGCSKKDTAAENKYPTVFKQNAIELLLHTKTLADGKVVFQLEKNIFLSNSQKQHMIISADTLPDLGSETINTEDEDENQVSQTVKKQYDVLFKVDSLRY